MRWRLPISQTRPSLFPVHASAACCSTQPQCGSTAVPKVSGYSSFRLPIVRRHSFASRVAQRHAPRPTGCNHAGVSTRHDRSVRRLERAQRTRELVRVHRRRHLESLDGYVLAVGDDWLLLANLDPGILLDGFTALRLRDVAQVQYKHTSDFVQSALDLRGQWPPATPGETIALASISALLESLRGQWPLVTVHLELDDPDVCFIGEVQRVGKRKLLLREISPRAAWIDLPGKFRLDDLTRVDVGASYERALVEVASHRRQVLRA